MGVFLVRLMLVSLFPQSWNVPQSVMLGLLHMFDFAAYRGEVGIDRTWRILRTAVGERFGRLVSIAIVVLRILV